MPFDVIETETRPMKDVCASISYRRNSTRHGRSKNPKLVIGIPKGVMGEFKPKDKQLFAFMLGSGKDEGRARIQPADKGVKPTLLKGGAVFRFGFVPMLGTDAAEKEHVGVRAVPGGFEIDLPPWFKNEA